MFQVHEQHILWERQKLVFTFQTSQLNSEGTNLKQICHCSYYLAHNYVCHVPRWPLEVGDVFDGHPGVLQLVDFLFPLLEP